MLASLREPSAKRQAAFFVLACVAFACRAHEGNSKSEEVLLVAGSWLQMYPARGAPDTLVVHADRTLSGSIAGLDALGIQHTHCSIEQPHMPEAFCFSTRPPHHGKQHCQLWLIEGDTLWLANVSGTTFLRSEAFVAGRAPANAATDPSSVLSRSRSSTCSSGLRVRTLCQTLCPQSTRLPSSFAAQSRLGRAWCSASHVGMFGDPSEDGR